MIKWVPLIVAVLLTCSAQVFYQGHIDCSQALELMSRDSALVNPVYFCKTDTGSFYHTTLHTAVCSDNLCRPVTMEVYWDLAGYYLRYDTLPGGPLTKNDHKPFTSGDYAKLHATLKDDNSILGEREKNELLEKSQARYSEKIDGWTGATRKEIKSAVVDGALYSTYTLWHLVNGNIRQQIQDYTRRHYNQGMASQLLSSAHPKTIIFGLKNMHKDDYTQQFSTIIDIMKAGNPLVNFYIAKKLPESVFDSETNQEDLKNIWNQLDKNTQHVLSKQLGSSIEN